MSALKNAFPSVMTCAGLTAALTLTLAGAAPEAQAATHAAQAFAVAASQQGAPYRWGGTGPNGFDCSGLTQYSYKRVGKHLPRTAAQQYNRTSRIGGRSPQRGDLVFFLAGQRVYHVGMYAGGGRILHAPKPGTRVRLEKIWTGSVRYGRVR
ncbi:C40 family peptidase [Streptomyces sp. NPDC048603]|uniref:C40 family peptidase n=1 Tax=Streptomyces sp. NPDC048603 TaxID=3365577 RepID=UPI0037166F3E